MNKDELIKDFTELQIECSKLKELLKDVRKLWKGTIFMTETQEQVRDVLTRINAVIGESEE